MGDMDIARMCVQIFTLLVAVVGHEIMHGLAAFRYGDMTAKQMGRLSVNPVSHIDPFGSVFMPLVLLVMQSPFLLGYAKPVPVDMDTVHRNSGYWACFVVSVAGIVYNLVVALLCVSVSKLLVGHGFVDYGGLLGYFFVSLVFINVLIAVFNSIPIPPLDGSRALSYFCLMLGISFFDRIFLRVEKYGIILVLAMILIPFTGDYFSSVVHYVVGVFYRVF